MRIKVELHLDQPLMRGLKLVLDGGTERWVDFKYEKLPYFCYSCGLIGHRYLACHKRLEEDQDSDSEDLPYPKSLMAIPFKSVTSKETSRGDSTTRMTDRKLTVVARGSRDKGKADDNISPHSLSDDAVSSYQGGLLDRQDNLNLKEALIEEGVITNKDGVMRGNNVNVKDSPRIVDDKECTSGQLTKNIVLGPVELMVGGPIVNKKYGQNSKEDNAIVSSKANNPVVGDNVTQAPDGLFDVAIVEASQDERKNFVDKPGGRWKRQKRKPKVEGALSSLVCYGKRKGNGASGVDKQRMKLSGADEGLQYTRLRLDETGGDVEGANVVVLFAYDALDTTKQGNPTVAVKPRGEI